MGAFRYCCKCDLPLDKPTVREDLRDGQRCSDGHLQSQWQDESEWIIEIEERLRDIEKRMEMMKKALDD